MKILVFGGSGFIGSALVPFLRYKGHTVHVFSRYPSSSEYYWDPEKKSLDPVLLEKVDGVINLAGENIFGRGSKEKLESIKKSRLESTDLLIKTLLSLSYPPSFYIGASAVGYYGDQPGEILTETSPPGHNFFSALCDQLESLGNRLAEKNIRVIHARLGIILAKEGGALEKMRRAFFFGLGGKLGKGQQMMSWLALDDLLNALLFVIEKESLKGAINFTSPQPVTNEYFTKTLAKKLYRPAFFGIPEGMLILYFGPLASLFLASAAVYPKVLLDAGFQFQFSDIESALSHIFKKNPAPLP